MNNNILIMISLRGGADALNMLVPYREPEYYRLRPTIAIPEPGKAGQTAIDLDGFWGLHPSLQPLLPLYERGELAFGQAIGWPGDTHSHFEAWEEIESGALGESRPTTGWLARYLQARSAAPRTPLRGVAFGEMLPHLLTGALGVSAIRRLEDYRLAPQAGTAVQHRMRGALRMLYGDKASRLGSLGCQTLDALDTLESVLNSERDGKSAYPQTTFGNQLRAIEQLIRAKVGLEAASAELIGWDTHFFQGTTDGLMAKLQGELAVALSTFADRMKDEMHRILVVVMTEFGRRVAENGSGGTDHGQGGAMMFLGGAVRGGRVYGEWPGLAEGRLVGPGDVAVMTDFRDVLGEAVAALLNENAVEHIFPQYRSRKRLGFLRN